MKLKGALSIAEHAAYYEQGEEVYVVCVYGKYYLYILESSDFDPTSVVPFYPESAIDKLIFSTYDTLIEHLEEFFDVSEKGWKILNWNAEENSSTEAKK